MEPQNNLPFFRKSQVNQTPFQPLDNLAKKRPSSTKLDLVIQF